MDKWRFKSHKESKNNVLKYTAKSKGKLQLRTVKAKEEKVKAQKTWKYMTTSATFFIEF